MIRGVQSSALGFRRLYSARSVLGSSWRQTAVARQWGGADGTGAAGGVPARGLWWSSNSGNGGDDDDDKKDKKKGRVRPGAKDGDAKKDDVVVSNGEEANKVVDVEIVDADVTKVVKDATDDAQTTETVVSREHVQ
jgi:hypothetical protein